MNSFEQHFEFMRKMSAIQPTTPYLLENSIVSARISNHIKVPLKALAKIHGESFSTFLAGLLLMSLEESLSCATEQELEQLELMLHDEYPDPHDMRILLDCFPENSDKRKA